MLVLISTSREKLSFGKWTVMVYPVVLPTHRSASQFKGRELTFSAQKSAELYQGKPNQELLFNCYRK